MRIAVIGAAGRTGREVVEQALARGHQVIAIARAPERLGLAHDRLELARADVRDPERLAAAVAGADALVSALGTGRSRTATDLYSAGVGNQLELLRNGGARKLVVISAAPAGPRAEQPPFERHVAMPLLERFFGPIYEDMRRMEALLAGSGADWVVLRPPRLLDKPATGRYRLDTKPLPKGRALTYPDLATALLDSLSRDDLTRRCAYVAN